ncbi:hypothetical protein QTV44_002486 [Vibrio vulnificus]|nr:hypothetical protein [Vibrio vulnificus]
MNASKRKLICAGTLVANARQLLIDRFGLAHYDIAVEGATLIVSWRDGQPEREVYAELKRFEHRDPNAPLSLFCQEFGYVEYVMVCRRYTDAAIVAALDSIANQYPEHSAQLSLDHFSRGALDSVYPANGTHTIHQLIARKLQREPLPAYSPPRMVVTGQVQTVSLPNQALDCFVVRLPKITDRSLFDRIKLTAGVHDGRYLSKREGQGVYGFLFHTMRAAKSFQMALSAVNN